MPQFLTILACTGAPLLLWQTIIPKCFCYSDMGVLLRIPDQSKSESITDFFCPKQFHFSAFGQWKMQAGSI